MSHVTEGTLRRMVDEPLAVAERDIHHVPGCARCSSRAASVESDARFASQCFSPALLASPEAGWRRFGQRGASAAPALVSAESPRRWRLMGATASTAMTAAAACLLIVAIVAAATLTAVFSTGPSQPKAPSMADVQELTSYFGLHGSPPVGGLGSLSGNRVLRFGQLTWRSSGSPQQVASLAAAESAAGFPMTLPSTLPSGVGSVDRIGVAPTLTATITFNASAGPKLSGSTLTVSLGPGIAVSYGGSTLGGLLGSVPPLVVAETPRPTASSTGAPVALQERFLLAQHGVPPNLARELKLLENPSQPLTVPAIAGVTSTPVQIGQNAGHLLSLDGGIATGAVWEDQQGMLHAVAGLLDQGDLLGVAQQLG